MLDDIYVSLEVPGFSENILTILHMYISTCSYSCYGKNKNLAGKFGT